MTTTQEEQVNEDSPNYGAKLRAAVAEAMAEVKRLAKADNNAFAKYKYTSVDDFKDALRPIMASHGLSVRADEVSCELLDPIETDDKKKARVAKFRFAFTLEHSSGERSIEEHSTVMLPYVGAQTTGQARSYALKEWLKSRFLASSGDSEDADAHDEDLTLSRKEARDLYTELQTGLREAAKQGKEAMQKWAVSRKPSINVLPKDWQLQLRRQYQEGLATGAIPESEEEEAPTVDIEAFLDDLETQLAGAKDAATVEEIFDNLDVQPTLTHDDAALERAFDLRNKRLAKFKKEKEPA